MSFGAAAARISLVNRRSFLHVSAAAAFAQSPPGFPIIDTHIHLFDPTRPQGVPWPERENAALYRPALPERYRGIAGPLGIKGAVVIEASPWFDDNQWVLDVAAKDPIILGVIGNLEPGKPEFANQLARFRRNRLFRGIRYGNLWGRDLLSDLNRPAFVDGLKMLAKAGLTLDAANPNPQLMAAALRVSERVPDLRIVLDHVPQMKLPDPSVRELGKRPNVFVKLSAVYRRIGSEVPRDVAAYRATLDELVSTFGEDRILYGSDWPNSDRLRPYGDVLAIVKEYFEAKPRSVAEKFFYRNALRAYRLPERFGNG